MFSVFLCLFFMYSLCKMYYKSSTAQYYSRSLVGCACVPPTVCNPIDRSPPGSCVHEYPRQEHCSGLPFPPVGLTNTLLAWDSCLCRGLTVVHDGWKRIRRFPTPQTKTRASLGPCPRLSGWRSSEAAGLPQRVAAEPATGGACQCWAALSQAGPGKPRGGWNRTPHQGEELPAPPAGASQDPEEKPIRPRISLSWES